MDITKKDLFSKNCLFYFIDLNALVNTKLTVRVSLQLWSGMELWEC
jgi:hypothetical protein